MSFCKCNQKTTKREPTDQNRDGKEKQSWTTSFLVTSVISSNLTFPIDLLNVSFFPKQTNQTILDVVDLRKPGTIEMTPLMVYTQTLATRTQERRADVGAEYQLFYEVCSRRKYGCKRTYL
uniref:Uncharacterized protein n=1 Tax=Lactuca sativa TaxID=4236 RepID=A0A9R1V3J8_LACSA|nr:hypothetical protein LSAT_V11C700363290 [Lactuca sativa]